MNDTRLNSPPLGRLRRAKSIIVLTTVALTALAFWAINWGCADPRKEPLTPAEPGYTETIDLFNMAGMGANGMASASFTVAQDLASSTAPGYSPARLRIAAYIVPDCQIYRRQQIMLDSIPFISDSVISARHVDLGAAKNSAIGSDTVRKKLLDTLEAHLKGTLDSLKGVAITYPNESFEWRGQTLTCDASRPFAHIVPDSASPGPDTTGLDSSLVALDSALAVAEMNLFHAQLDTTLLGLERDFLGAALDAYYALSIALDTTSAFYFPNAAYADTAGNVGGQRIYAAALDSTSGMMGRGFLLGLDQFQVADITHIGRTFEVNWAVCFPGSTSPCLAPGTHTLYVRMPGPVSRVSGTIVLVYAQRV